MNYQGSCHCGNIKFAVEGNIDGAVSCNCSICLRKGSLLSFFTADKFTLLSTGENVGTYLFNKHVIQHKFCQVCGVSSYSEGKDKKGDLSFAVNIRCIDGIDLQQIPVTLFNGKDY